MHILKHITAVSLCAVLCSSAAVAAEQYNAAQMWGTSPSTSASDSATTHLADGVIAGQVNAARDRLLLSTGSSTTINVQSIGSQNVVNNTVTGDGNTVNVGATQDSSNTGTVSNNGQINSGQ